MSIAKILVITQEDWLGLDLKYRLRRLSYKAETLVVLGKASVLEALRQVHPTLVLLESCFLENAEIVGAINVMNLPILVFNATSTQLRNRMRSHHLHMIADVQDEATLDAAIYAALEHSCTQTRLAQHQALVCAVDHEIRTPLGTLLLTLDSIEQLEEEALSQTSLQKLDYLERSRESVERIVNLLDHSSSLCRSSSKDLVWNPSAIHLPTFCMSLVESLIHHSRLVFTDYYSDLRTIYFDETVLIQVLTNLLNNAIKYSDEESIVHFSLQVDDQFMVIRVQDQGIGIAKEECDRIFTPFYRGSNVESIQGTGMGLAIAHQLVTACQGTITLESQLGIGSTFTVTIPIKHYAVAE